MGIWGSNGSAPAMDVACPHCGAREYMDIRGAFTASIRGGQVVQVECGRCVACLSCDSPYVIVAHRPGGVIVRRRVAAGQEMPEPMPHRAPSGAGQRIVDGLSSALGGANLTPDEPL